MRALSHVLCACTGMGFLMLKAGGDPPAMDAHCRCTRMLWVKASSVEVISDECYSGCGTISLYWSGHKVYEQHSKKLGGLTISAFGDLGDIPDSTS